MASDGVRDLRVNAAELLRQPGATKPIDTTVSALELEVLHDALDGDVTVDVELEAMNDGITVRGVVSAPWKAPCRRCLKDLSGIAEAPVDEIYQVELTDEDAFPIENNQLDLAPMARQTVLLELDEERLCREACAGLCPVCGVDRNETDCSCDTTIKDDRWSALEGLQLDD